MVIDPVTSHNTFQIYHYEDYYLLFLSLLFMLHIYRNPNGNHQFISILQIILEDDKN